MKISNPRTNGFTLIELLVVISIIALLIGILLPALGAARGVAQISASGSNQRQIGVAMAAYMGSNNGYFPSWQQDSTGDGVSGTILWFWTTRMAADGFIQDLAVYADPTFDAPTPFEDVPVIASAGASSDIASTSSDGFQGGRGDNGDLGSNLDDRRFNRIHYGYNYVHVGANYHKSADGSIRSPASVRDLNPRAKAASNVPARLEDMQDPTTVLVTTGVRDYVLTNDPPFDDGTRATEGEWGAHVVFDYPQLQNSTGNGGIPHARYGDNLQVMWGDGHVSSFEVPFTQKEQDADMLGGGTPDNAVFDNDALGSPSNYSVGGGRGGGAPVGNYFDIVASRSNN
ncbi:MAG: type II secretion system protein [Planctomycetota bacterium]